MTKTFIDSSVFMSLHSKDEGKRLAAKNFFVTNFDKEIFMNLEEVGICDDIVWGFPREIQDSYYPFMDNIHSLMKLNRVPYTQEAVMNFQTIGGFSTTESLLLSAVTIADSKLFTFNEKILERRQENIVAPDSVTKESAFEERLEKLYKDSLLLRVK